MLSQKNFEDENALLKSENLALLQTNDKLLQEVNIWKQQVMEVEKDLSEARKQLKSQVKPGETRKEVEDMQSSRRIKKIREENVVLKKEAKGKEA